MWEGVKNVISILSKDSPPSNFPKKSLNFSRDQRKPNRFERKSEGKGRKEGVSQKMRTLRKNPKWIRTKSRVGRRRERRL